AEQCFGQRAHVGEAIARALVLHDERAPHALAERRLELGELVAVQDLRGEPERLELARERPGAVLPVVARVRVDQRSALVPEPGRARVDELLEQLLAHPAELGEGAGRSTPALGRART